MELIKGTVRTKVRQDTAANWTLSDPILGSGEFGFETDTGFLKCGDGSSVWTALSYVNVDKVEGANLLSTGVPSMYVLKSDGDESCSWAAVNQMPVEGVSIVSTGETGGTKFLREDGDNSCSWQTPAGGGSGADTFIIGDLMQERMGSVNDWYNARSNMNPASGDPLGGYIATYDWFTLGEIAPVNATVKAYYAITTFPSQEPYDFSLWKGVILEGGSNVYITITQVGSTQSYNSGGDCTADKIFSISETGLSVSINAGEFLFHCIRYNDGSGTKYAYGKWNAHLEVV